MLVKHKYLDRQLDLMIHTNIHVWSIHTLRRVIENSDGEGVSKVSVISRWMEGGRGVNPRNLCGSGKGIFWNNAMYLLM